MKNHRANVELSKKLKVEISKFFDDENKRVYLKYFTEDEARALRDKHFSKKT